MSELLETQQTRRFIYEFFWSFLVYAALIGCTMHRYFKTRYVAKTKRPFFTFSIKLKFLLTFLQMIIFALIITASYLNEYVWFADRPGFSLLFLFPMAVLLFQEYFLLNDYNKKLPFVWYTHTLFWALQSLTNVCLFIDTHLNISLSDITWTIDLIRCSNTVLLIILGAIKRQDLPGFEDSLTNPFKKSDYMQALQINGKSPKIVISKVPSRILEISSFSKKPLESSEVKNSDGSKSQRPVFTFNCVVKRNLITVDNGEPKYQINIEIGKKEEKLQKYKLSYTLQEVVIFLHHLASEFPQLMSSNQLSELRVAPGVSAAKDMLDKKAKVELLLNKTIKNELFSSNFCKFFAVPEEYQTSLKRKLEKHKAAKKAAEDEKSSGESYNSEKSSFSIESPNLRKDSSRVFIELAEESTVRTQGIKSEQANNILRLTELINRNTNADLEYFQYFYVRIREHVRNLSGNFMEYILEFQLIENQDERWSCKKRFSDFLQLDHELKKIAKAPLPALPGKGFMLTEKAYDDRKKGLEKYLRTVLNEKVYFTAVLFDFIELKKDYYDGFLFEDSGKECLVKLRKAEFKETLLMVSEEDKQPFTSYSIKITEYADQLMLKKIGSYYIIKRFSDFERLNKDLQIRFQAQRSFPAFPSKLEGFTAKSTINYRRAALEKYLNEIFLLDNINDSYAFRNFIKFSPEAYDNARNSQSILIEKEAENQTPVPNMFTSANKMGYEKLNTLDDENLEKLSLARNKFKT